MKKAYRHFISDNDEQRILQAIAEAEQNTSGEIRIHLQRNKKGDIMQNAIQTFKKLGMHKTALRNGILFYIDIDRKEFAVVGDEGIHRKVAPGFWQTLAETLRHHFSHGQYTEGIIAAILQAGEALKQYFPYRPGDINELPDDISFG